MHFDLIFGDEVHGVELALLKVVDYFLLIFAATDVEDEFIAGEGVCLVEWAFGHLLSVFEHH